MSDMIAPDVCAIVEYHETTWRVDAWLKVAVRPEAEDFNGFLDQILYDTSYERDGDRFQWCIRAEATHLSLYSVCGALAKVEDCKVIGRVEWTEEMIDQQRQTALCLVGELVC